MLKLICAFLRLQNDRKWAVLDADKNVILTARELPKAGSSEYVSAPALTYVGQLVLIDPKLQYDLASPTKGRLVVNVPLSSGTVALTVPIEPTPDILANWPL